VPERSNVPPLTSPSKRDLILWTFAILLIFFRQAFDVAIDALGGDFLILALKAVYLLLEVGIPSFVLWDLLSRNETKLAVLQSSLDESRLGEYIARLPTSTTDLSFALRELVAYHSRQHKGGLRPIKEGLTTEIQVQVLSEEAARETKYNIPTPPLGYSWIWFRFTIKNEWDFRPVDLGDEALLTPADLIGDVLVMNYQTYVRLHSRLSPITSVYYPVAPILERDNALKSALAHVRYLHGGNNGLEIQITKRSRSRSKSTGQATITLEPFFSQLDPTSKAKEIKRAFPDIESMGELLAEAAAGVYEIFRWSHDTSNLDKIRIALPEDRGAWWHVSSTVEYIVPMKVTSPNDPSFLNQQIFEFPIDRVATVNSLKFINTSGGNLSFTRLPVLYCFPYVSDPENVKRIIEGDTQLVDMLSEHAFWFPGDSVTFNWQDNLIAQLSAANSKDPTSNNT
jgi:hypothetical protein